MVCKDSNCCGDHMHIIGQGFSYIGSDFNDCISSFVILGGNWMFFKDTNFNTGLPLSWNPGWAVSIGPGVYNSIEAILGPGSNDCISSLLPVNIPAGETNDWSPPTGQELPFDIRKLPEPDLSGPAIPFLPPKSIFAENPFLLTKSISKEKKTESIKPSTKKIRP